MTSEFIYPAPHYTCHKTDDPETNGWYNRLNASGTSLAACFDYSEKPVRFPELAGNEQLTFEYLLDGEDDEDIARSVLIPDLKTMQKWYNVGRLDVVEVVGWRVVAVPEDSPQQ